MAHPARNRAPFIRSRVNASAYASLKLAAAAVPTGGGTLYLPAGYTWNVSAGGATTDNLKAGTIIEGAPTSAIVGTDYKLIDMSGGPVDRLQFVGCTFHLQATQNLRTMLDVTGCSNVQFSGCTFREDGGAHSAAWTTPAILFSGNGVAVNGCNFFRCQAKLAGTLGTSGATIRGCTFAEALQYGMSFVLATTGQTLEDLLIENCTFTDPLGNGCIYLGNDPAGVQATGIMRRITIRNNTASGAFSSSQCGFVNLHYCATNSDISIVDNSAIATSIVTNTYGISCDERTGGGTITGLEISRNTLSNFDLFGISVDGTATATIAGNTISNVDAGNVNDCGIFLRGRASGTLTATVTGNHVTSAPYPLRATAALGAVTATYSGNTWSSCTNPVAAVSGAALTDGGGNVTD